MKAILLFIIFNGIVLSQQAELLEKAYRLNSQVLLVEFFMNWQNEIKPVTKDEYEQQNDTMKAVYYIYNSVFNSFEKKSFTDYLVLSDNIYIGFYDFFYDKYWTTDTLANNIIRELDVSFVSKSDTISELWAEAFYGSRLSALEIANFRPFITGFDKIVYLNSMYKKVIYNFMFGVSYKDDFSAMIEKSTLPKRQICKRTSFLQNAMPVPYIKYTGEGILYKTTNGIKTEPEILAVNFANNFQTAQVDYFMNCNLCRAYLVKTENQWKVLSRKEIMCVCG